MTIIRNAIISDVKALSQLAKLCFSDTFGHLYTKDDLSSHLQETCSPEFFSKSLTTDIILVAENYDGSLVGYIKFGDLGLPIKNIHEGSKEIHRLYIHPDFKRKNIGSNLMQHAFTNPILETAKHYYLSVYENNIIAQNFYKDFGFTIIGKYDYYVGAHIDIELIMHKTNSN